VAMRRILSRLATLLSLRTWNNFLSRGDSWFFVGGHLYVLDSEGTTRVQESTQDHPYPGNNGRLFRRVFSKEELATGHQLSVLISGLGRFGNGIQQFVHSVSFALVTNSAEVLFFPNSTTSERANPRTDQVSLQPLSSPFRRREDPPGHIWRSDFFEAGLKLHVFDQQVADLIRPALQELYKALLSSAVVSDGVLTIHLRSGDVFGTKPHPGYGQPPLSFYRLIVDSMKWERVEVVAEDSSNPCMAPLLSYLSECGIPTSVTGETLADATRALSSARNLVASRGTFAPAILYLTDTTKKVFVFNGEIDKIPGGPQHSYQNVFDDSGTYTEAVLSSNWMNSKSQRQLMLEYPATRLSMAPMPPL